MKPLNRYILLFFVGIFSYGGTVSASLGKIKAPKYMKLIFDDQILTLNFNAQPDLLQSKIRHYFLINGKKMELDFFGKLPEESAYLNIETEFYLAISKVRLLEFLKETAILRPQKGKPVEIRIEEAQIFFDGRPQDGYEIEIDKLVNLIDRALALGGHNIRVPAVKKFSPVVVHPDLSDRGISEIIAVGESNFTGSSAARRQNILAGAQKFNGVIIPKGKRFSFNDILESVEEEDGFVKELVIKGNTTEKELGGGVCQVSTTAFRAAFSGGFPISQRRAHSYAVPYYKPFGLDAAIYLGALDLRFKNDTPGDILIQTFVENDNLFFVFYGTKDDRKVVFEGPFISEYKKAPEAIVYETEDLPRGEMEELSEEHDGFRSEWIRRVELDGNTEKESFISTYKPWPAKVRKGISARIRN